jgi:ketosteroid isomerase-like protein
LTFCVDDGTPLVAVDLDGPADSAADEATVVRSSSGADAGSPWSSNSYGSGSQSPAPPYQPPGSYVPPGTPPGYASPQGKRRTWLWLLGLLVIVLVVFGGLGVAAVLLIPRTMQRETANTNNSNVYVVPNNSNSNRGDANANSNSSDWNQNLNSNSTADDTTPAPTDEATVLANLTDLEHDWTVANINADKKKLNLILADDYVGTLPGGQLQGKAEYLRTATPDTAIQKWNFENLKISLRGDRASLTGVLQLEITNEQGQKQSLAFRFTDKFVWRDGRWQATASEVEPVKVTGVSA